METESSHSFRLSDFLQRLILRARLKLQDSASSLTRLNSSLENGLDDLDMDSLSGDVLFGVEDFEVETTPQGDRKLSSVLLRARKVHHDAFECFPRIQELLDSNPNSLGGGSLERIVSLVIEGFGTLSLEEFLNELRTARFSLDSRAMPPCVYEITGCGRRLGGAGGTDVSPLSLLSQSPIEFEIPSLFSSPHRESRDSCSSNSTEGGSPSEPVLLSEFGLHGESQRRSSPDTLVRERYDTGGIVVSKKRTKVKVRNIFRKKAASGMTKVVGKDMRTSPGMDVDEEEEDIGNDDCDDDVDEGMIVTPPMLPSSTIVVVDGDNDDDDTREVYDGGGSGGSGKSGRVVRTMSSYEGDSEKEQGSKCPTDEASSDEKESIQEGSRNGSQDGDGDMTMEETLCSEHTEQIGSKGYVERTLRTFVREDRGEYQGMKEREPDEKSSQGQSVLFYDDPHDHVEPAPPLSGDKSPSSQKTFVLYGDGMFAHEEDNHGHVAYDEGRGRAGKEVEKEDHEEEKEEEEEMSVRVTKSQARRSYRPSRERRTLSVGGDDDIKHMHMMHMRHHDSADAMETIDMPPSMMSSRRKTNVVGGMRFRRPRHHSVSHPRRPTKTSPMLTAFRTRAISYAPSMEEDAYTATSPGTSHLIDKTVNVMHIVFGAVANCRSQFCGIRDRIRRFGCLLEGILFRMSVMREVPKIFMDTSKPALEREIESWRDRASRVNDDLGNVDVELFGVMEDLRGAYRMKREECQLMTT
eukprot:TRINITY_DN877_c2_g1_i1.p1 TRINITY_DN877_c2_g1~~TRINITY_DN877_c2_g1_i1.p1  ORF type:complete len:749 (-),score=203.70 TRINITY_DN877_c2_g1_i1:177-2423(-)